MYPLACILLAARGNAHEELPEGFVDEVVIEPSHRLTGFSVDAQDKLTCWGKSGTVWVHHLSLGDAPAPLLDSFCPLDASGRASTVFVIRPTTNLDMIVQAARHAFLVFDLSTITVSAVGEGVKVHLTP